MGYGVKQWFFLLFYTKELPWGFRLLNICVSNSPVTIIRYCSRLDCESPKSEMEFYVLRGAYTRKASDFHKFSSEMKCHPCHSFSSPPPSQQCRRAFYCFTYSLAHNRMMSCRLYHSWKLGLKYHFVVVLFTRKDDIMRTEKAYDASTSSSFWLFHNRVRLISFGLQSYDTQIETHDLYILVIFKQWTTQKTWPKWFLTKLIILNRSCWLSDIWASDIDDENNSYEHD